MIIYHCAHLRVFLICLAGWGLDMRGHHQDYIREMAKRDRPDCLEPLLDALKDKTFRGQDLTDIAVIKAFEKGVGCGN